MARHLEDLLLAAVVLQLFQLDGGQQVLLFPALPQPPLPVLHVLLLHGHQLLQEVALLLQPPQLPLLAEAGVVLEHYMKNGRYLELKLSLLTLHELTLVEVLHQDLLATLEPH